MPIYVVCPCVSRWAGTPGACAELHICMPIYVVCPCVSRWACTPGACVELHIWGKHRRCICLSE
ncbi:hypothetical protein Syun_029281 [Stephania yunnanensis]|uniref:Uncharacterized protein n=1 Tax=Stephania yunnanensis TaxID=152371 RepID=A0AAP0E8P4_9MAGN